MLWLIGMMGSGKSTVGARVAERLGIEFLDLDTCVAMEAGIPIGEIFIDGGEARFREIESATLAAIAEGSSKVVATGGGVVLDDRNVERMRSTGTVVWLIADPSLLADRIGNDAERPLLGSGDNAERLSAILKMRSHRYSAAAHWSVDTTDHDADAVAEEVIRRWQRS